MRQYDLFFNGVDEATGNYLKPPMRLADLARLRFPSVRRDGVQRRLRADLDPRDLADAGWGVIFGPDATPSVREALRELLSYRKCQATARDSRLYREMTCHLGESKEGFLRRHGTGPGPVDPAKVPYYLLIVSGPEAVPFAFQYQLAVQYAVGRLWFETPAEYASYTRGVIAAERRPARREAVLFASRHQGDELTRLSADDLVLPLAETLARRHSGWRVRTVVGEDATKERLARLAGGEETPALLFTATHGLGFGGPEPRQASLQGALVCQDWPGPGSGSVQHDHLFAGRDLTASAHLQGLIAFHFACYSAGTPRWDPWPSSGTEPRPLAEHDLIAELPRRLLGHPGGGALAVIGHVGSAWRHSFVWHDAGPQLQSFDDTLGRLLDGAPVGLAMEAFGERYAEIAADLSARLEPRPDAHEAEGDLELALLWLAQQDARSYLLLGDPAVRLGKVGRGPRRRGERSATRERAGVVTRYTDITAPRRLPRGRRGVVTVRLTRHPVAESEWSERLRVAPQPLELHLHGNDGVEVCEETVRTVAIEPDRDSELAVFFVRGVRAGTSVLVLDVRQSGSVIASIPLHVVVVPETGAEEQDRIAPRLLVTGGPDVPPPDLDLRVVIQAEGGHTVLRYILHSPNGEAGFHYQPAGSVTLVASPERYQAQLLERIESQSRPADLEALGHRLYDELWSEPLKGFYRRFRLRAATVQVTSDEPWIPWELVKPYDGDEQIDDDFLGARFQMTRWLAGRSGPAGEIQVSRFACVEPGRVPGRPRLPHAGGERRRLADLLQPAADCSPDPPDRDAVRALLAEGGIGLWHFATHGDANPEHPDAAVVLLAGGDILEPMDLHGLHRDHIARDRPLVFLNACRVAQQGWSLTRLGGWAAAWVDRCRCGAFLGPLWSVDDRPAAEYACGFYEALERGATVGEAIKAAQERARAADPDSPTWLAYAVYAHPNAWLDLAPADSPAEGGSHGP